MDVSSMAAFEPLLDSPNEYFELLCRLRTLEHKKLGLGLGASDSAAAFPPQPLLKERAARRRNAVSLRMNKRIEGEAHRRRFVDTRVNRRH